MATVLSGTSGALYYKPAGTKGTFAESGVNATSNVITVDTYLNFKVGDPVEFSMVNVNTGASGTGTLPAGLSAGTTYYVIGYTASTGALTVSTSAGGSAVDISDDGTAVSPNAFQVAYDDYTAVGQVREWSLEITRDEIDVTTIGATLGQYAPFKTYITGYANGQGKASVYLTDESETIANRMVEDVLQRQQVGAAFKLYIDRISSSGTVSDTLSRSISMEAVLTSASLKVNPADAQVVEINFRPSNAPSFDWSKTA